MMTNRSAQRVFVVAFAVLLWSGSPSRASFVADGAPIQLISPPPSVALGQLQSDQYIQGFAEKQGMVLGSAVNVDTTAPGAVSLYGDLNHGQIAAGTNVNSYLFHSEGFASTSANPDVFSGTISFDTKILGLIVLDGTLDSTDAQFGAPGTTYSSGLFGRGLELNPAGDYFSISSDMMSISFTITTGGVMDEFRVLTAIPEPASVVLMGLGGLSALGLGSFRLKRKAA